MLFVSLLYCFSVLTREVSYNYPVVIGRFHSVETNLGYFGGFDDIKQGYLTLTQLYDNLMV